MSDTRIDIDFIAEAITDALGERCAEYGEGCPTCEAWKEYDRLRALDNVPASPSPISADAVVEACAKVADAEAAFHNTGSGFDSQSVYSAATDIAAAIRALKGTFPAAPEAKSEVAVKPLEWDWPNKYGLICRAKTSIGTYSVSDNEDSSGGSLLCYLHLTEEADSTRWAIEIFHGYAELNEVQAAAQIDYETRIRSALVDPEGRAATDGETKP